jgi:protein-tyrosine phosphatase
VVEPTHAATVSGRDLRDSAREPVLTDVIDIHCHILPGIDDGPTDLESSLEMARAAVAAGITTVVATPHLRADFPQVKIDEIADRVDALAAALAEQEIALELVPGGEVGLTWALEADADALQRASYGQHGRDILIETPTVGGSLLPALLGQVAARGYRVILAHPERLAELGRNPDLIDRLIERDIRLQVNADGLVANPRKSPIAKAAQSFCRAGLVTVVASDAHRGLSWRPITALAGAREAIATLTAPDNVDRLLQSGPAAILAGERLAPVMRSEGDERRLKLPWRH